MPETSVARINPELIVMLSGQVVSWRESITRRSLSGRITEFSCEFRLQSRHQLTIIKKEVVSMERHHCLIYMRCNLHYMRCILHYMRCLSYYMHCVSYYMRCFCDYMRYFCNDMQCFLRYMRCFRGDCDIF